jgi:hypothetical protein
MGLLTETEISTGKGRIKALQPTKKGYGILGMDKGERQTIGNPGPEHEYWKNRVADHYRKLGYDVEIEKHIGDGKSVDIAASNTHETIAIEIETGKSDAVYNIIKDIEAGFDKVISVALDNPVKNKIIKEINDSDIAQNNNIEILLAQKLVE